MITVLQGTPEDYIRTQLQPHSVPMTFALRYGFEQYYLAAEPVIDLLALISVSADEFGVQCWSGAVGSIKQLTDDQLQALDDECSEPEQRAIAGALSWPWLALDKALPLISIEIKKPWGQEVWFTGIEERGQSQVGTATAATPLPWLLSLAPGRMCGNQHKNINLLKILDPLSEDVFGDLYFELHQKKQEVYVVTHVDKQAWPTGQGGIRFGFNEEALKRYGSDIEFKQAFSEAVSGYESVRREIDQQLDTMRTEEGVALDAPVMAEQTKVWLASVSAELREREVRLRKSMDDFKGFKPLLVGDVVKVPCFTPHSLLHGVRTIEFQTPVYERQILSFGQKVLTQDHWDTEQALECMSLEAPADEPLVRLFCDELVGVDEVVSFDDFDVWRVRLAAGATWQLPSAFDYALVMGLVGVVGIAGLNLAAEEGALLPAPAAGSSAVNNTGSELIFLLALPR